MTRTSMRVVITAPSAKRRLAGKVRFRAKVLGGRTITRVEFRINGRLRWTDRTKPYAFRGMRGRWNTAAVRTGTHVLQVVAYDRAGRRVGARRVVRIVRGRRGRAAPTVASPPSSGRGRPVAVRAAVHRRPGERLRVVRQIGLGPAPPPRRAAASSAPIAARCPARSSRSPAARTRLERSPWTRPRPRTPT